MLLCHADPHENRHHGHSCESPRGRFGDVISTISDSMKHGPPWGWNESQEQPLAMIVLQFVQFIFEITVVHTI